MRPAKKQSSRSDGLFSWLFGAGRPAVIVLALLVVLAGGWYLAWRRVGPRVLASAEYQVGPGNVEIFPPLPDWIHTDLRTEVFRHPTLDGALRLLDDDLTERIARAFESHPWVSKVVRVSKHFPAQVQVELVYRRPACMVEVPGGGLLAVDADGVLLPSEENFSPVEAGRYPRVLGVDRMPTIAVGRRWSDPRVVGGAEIAAAIGQAWEPMRLKYILPLPVSTTEGRTSEPIFVLQTLAGSRITWGYAPGANALGEPSAVEKVARLQRRLAENDSLDGLRGKPQEYDVRKLGRPI